MEKTFERFLNIFKEKSCDDDDIAEKIYKHIQENDIFVNKDIRGYHFHILLNETENDREDPFNEDSANSIEIS